MPTYHADLAAQPVPRYTSYPTAVDFTPAVGAERQALALLGIGRDMPVSLYLHVPYCEEICWYCGCNTGAAGRPARLDAYVEALLAEIATVAALVDGRITAIHVGGGSPNILAPGQLRRIADAIRDQFGVDEAAEWAIEIDPRGFDAARAETLAAIGVGRVSIGVQTFDPAIQRAIHRVQPYAVVADAVDRLRAVRIRHLNLDLLYGLPLQRCDDVAATIADALTLRPSRVAMFGYAHLPGLLPRQRMIDAATLPDREERFRQGALAERLLTDAGYRAAVRDGRLAGVRGVRRDAEDRLRAAIIERLLCDGTVDLAAIDAGRAHALLDQARAALAPLEDRGIARRSGNRLYVREADRCYRRLVAAAFDTRRSRAPAAPGV